MQYAVIYLWLLSAFSHVMEEPGEPARDCAD